MKSSSHNSDSIVHGGAPNKRAKHSHDDLNDSESSSDGSETSSSSSSRRDPVPSSLPMPQPHQNVATAAAPGILGSDARQLLQAQAALNLSSLQQPSNALPLHENPRELLRAALALEERKRALSNNRIASTQGNLQELLTLSQLARQTGPTVADPLLRSLLTSSSQQGDTLRLAALMQAQQSLSVAPSVLSRVPPLASNLNGFAALAGLPLAQSLDPASRLTPQLLEAQVAAARRGASLSTTIPASTPSALGDYLRQQTMRTGGSSAPLSEQRDLLLRLSASGVPKAAQSQKDGTTTHRALDQLQQRQLSSLSQGSRGLRATTGTVDERVPFSLRGILPSHREQTTSHRPDDPSKTPTASYEGDDLVPLALPAEQFVMSEYQCLLRQQIVFIAAKACDNEGKTQGRNKPIVQGQVGIICKYCARLPRRQRPRGAAYYPAMLHRIYQAAQNMSHNHFMGSCRVLPPEVRHKLVALKDQKVVTIGAGKEYWLSAAMTVGVREGEQGLHLCKDN